METPHFELRFWCRPVTDSRGFARVDGDSCSRDDEPKEGDRSAQKRAFGDVGEELLFLEFGAESLEVSLVFGGGSTVDQDIVKIYDQELTNEGPQHFIHQAHEGTRGVG